MEARAGECLFMGVPASYLRPLVRTAEHRPLAKRRDTPNPFPDKKHFSQADRVLVMKLWPDEDGYALPRSLRNEAALPLDDLPHPAPHVADGLLDHERSVRARARGRRQGAQSRCLGHTLARQFPCNIVDIRKSLTVGGRKGETLRGTVSPLPPISMLGMPRVWTSLLNLTCTPTRHGQH